MARRTAATLALGVLGVAGLCIAAPEPEWPGWHGLTRQGIGASPCPTSWSTNRNVAWRTAIPGEGHSSPIVSGDAVFVTTAYRVGMTVGAKRATRRAAEAAAVLVLAGAAVTAFRRGGGPRALGFLFAAGTVAGLVWRSYDVLWAEKVDHGLRIVRWMDTATLVTMGVLAAAAGLRPRAAARVLAAALLLAAPVAFVLLRPNPSYYGFFDGALHTQRALRAVAAQLGLAGLLLAAVAGFAGWRTRPASEAGGRAWPRGLAAALAATVLAAGLGLPWLITACGPAIGRLVGWLQCGVSAPMVLVAAGLGASAAVACAWLAAEWIPRPAAAAAVAPAWLRGAVLALVAGVWVDMNLLGVRRDYERAVVCVDRAGGAIRWVAKGLTGPQSSLHNQNTPASPTPVCDGERVYAYFGSAGAMAVDRRGRIVWTNRDLPFDDIHGVGASPVLHGGRLVILADMPQDPYITALDPATGRPVWRKGRKGWTGSHGCHCTPLAANPGGTNAVIVWQWTELFAYDTDTGKRLWKFKVPGAFCGERVANPILDNGVLYVPDKSGLTAVPAAPAAGGTAVPLWTARMGIRGPNTCTAVLKDGLLFTVSDDGHASCLDATTGAVRWQQPFRCAFLASVVATPDAVYFCGSDGRVRVTAPSADYRLLAENDMGEAIYATPAPVAGRLYVRTAHSLWCIATP